MKKTILVAIAILSFGISAFSQERTYFPDGTYMFVKRDTCDLFLDVYKAAKDSETTYNGKAKPTVLFIFGGGFIDGQRDKPYYMKWFKQLNDEGHNVVSIDYRLGLKGVHGVGIAQANAIDKAIHIAVEDLFSATNFLLENGEELGIDANNMIVSGSSAGAITALQAEYEICNGTSWAQVLPEDFNYVGVMSFSGAIFSRKGKIKFTEKQPCPILLLHGTADKIVNYTQTVFANLGFFGAKPIAKRLEKFGCNYNIWRFDGNGHEIASSMGETWYMQEPFIKFNVMDGQKRILDALLDTPQIEKTTGSLKEMYN
ncbi:MAG: alpha/beta hydrolase fold domain-containing protein [Candidatus Cryptobacteroides sp.]